ncbi:MAG TPA: PIN domain-containing protein [Longimicrobiales bacterium]
MILVDTSVWIGHLRRTDPHLVELLEAGEVVTHPMVIGELACGTLPERESFLRLLSLLPAAPVASDAEALGFIESERLMGRGIGYVDVHVLASARLGGETRLWTADARLAAAARRLFVGYDPRAG